MRVELFFLIIPAGLVLLALILFRISHILKKRTGLPDGDIIYTDHGKWGHPNKPLYDSNLGLTGKPDYIIRSKNTIIPVEVKSRWAPRVPFDSHKLQLAAYCLLVERYYGIRPPYGLLRYRNRTFRVKFNKELEFQVMDLLDEIRQQKEAEEVWRSHQQKNRCARCGYREKCDQRL
jgi:CRISPR-associated exonuclease Cas4